jgi:hypothetical protein
MADIAVVKRNIGRMIDQLRAPTPPTPDAVAPSASADASPAPTDRAPPTTLLDRVAPAVAAGREGIADAISFSFNDEIEGGLLTPIEMLVRGFQGQGFSPTEAFNAAVKRVRDSKAKAYEEHPVAAGVGNLAGSVATGGKLAQKGLTLAGRMGTGLVPRVGAAAIEGGVQGGLSGAGAAEGGLAERAQGAATGAATGALTAGLVEGTVGNGLVRSAARKDIIPSTKMAEVSGNYYDTAKTAWIKPQVSDTILDDVANKTVLKDTAGNVALKADRLDAIAHPYSNTARNILLGQKSMSNSAVIPSDVRRLNLEQMQENLQKIDGELLGMATGTDRDMLVAMSKNLRNRINMLKDPAFDTPNGAKAVKGLKRAVFIGKTQKKTEILEGVRKQVNKLKYNKPQELRNRVSDILASSEGKLFTNRERLAMQKVADGSIPDKVLELAALASPRTLRGATLSTASIASGQTWLAAIMTILGEGSAAAVRGRTNAKMDDLLRMVSRKQSRETFLKKLKPRVSSRVAGKVAGQLSVEEEQE